MVGPFFCISDKVYAHLVPLDEAEPYGACLTAPVSHLDFWDASLASGFPDTEYDFFSRGRVVYKEGVFIIYLDRCLDDLPAIEAILTEFGIGGEPWHIECDEHYQCAACMAQTGGEVVFDSAVREVFGSSHALAALHPSQYAVFEAAMQQAFSQIYKRAETHSRVDAAGHIQLIWRGTPLDVALSKAEQQATELAYKAALAEVLEKKLVLFRPTAMMDTTTTQRARRFIESLPKEQVIVSAPFGGY